MGGCCCGASKEPQPLIAPEFRRFSRTSEDYIPLPSSHATPPSVSTGLLVDTNLETSTIDTFRAPPRPTPYNVDSRNLNSRPTEGLSGNKSNEAEQTANSESVDNDYFKNQKESECKSQSVFELESEKAEQVELSKSKRTFSLAIEEEDACPICLEEYDAENPKLTTQCEHEYHLACILEWMERSETCPICDQEMIFNPSING